MRRPCTNQTRLTEYVGIDRVAGAAALSARGELYGRAQRKLFTGAAARRPTASLKSEYLRRYGIPAQMFNGVRVSLEGKVASATKQQNLLLDSSGWRIARSECQVADAALRGRWDQVHQRRLPLAALGSKLAALQGDIEGDGCGCASVLSACGASSTI